jgi:hypothetical protein
MQLVEHGTIAVLGNHDSAVNDTSAGLKAEARIVIDWTRG